jgi:hypothetical protein
VEQQNREIPRLTRFTVKHPMAPRVGTSIVNHDDAPPFVPI